MLCIGFTRIALGAHPKGIRRNSDACCVIGGVFLLLLYFNVLFFNII